MKKLLLVTVVLATFANAGDLWDMVKNAGSDGTIKTKQYTLEVAGTNTRAYIFPVKEMNSICILTYSLAGHPAINCKTIKEMEK